MRSLDHFRFLIRTLFISIVLALLTLTTIGQITPGKDSRYYEIEAMKAYQEKNYPAFLDNMKQAVSLRPNHPRLMYNLSAAYALNGKQSEALSMLRQTAEMGLVFPAGTDHDFDSLREVLEFKTIVSTFERNRQPKISSVAAFTVHEKGLVPESVAYDPVSNTFYLSSVYKRKILAVTPTGASIEFSRDSDGLWSVLGMKVDARRRLLWVCTAAHRQMSGYRVEDEGKSALFKYDLKSGRLIDRFEILDRTRPHWLGDLAINSAGDVFATDTATPAIYVLRHTASKLETFLEGAPFLSLQGLDFSSDGKHLFLADYSKGLFLIDPETKRCSPIVSTSTLMGIDGLYFYKGGLLGVQNGVSPERIVRLTLSKDSTHVERFETLEANNPVFDEITLGVLVKNNFYFIANSQWRMIDQQRQLAPEVKLKNPTVLRLKLRSITGDVE